MTNRKDTRPVHIKDIVMGGQDKVLIQSMCNIKTEKVEQVVKQINECAKLGADLMRVSVMDEADAYAIGEIKKQISIPLVADIHFDYRLALIAMRMGVDKVRINPGNIGSFDKIKEVVDLAKEKHIPIRIGVKTLPKVPAFRGGVSSASSRSTDSTASAPSSIAFWTAFSCPRAL